MHERLSLICRRDVGTTDPAVAGFLVEASPYASRSLTRFRKITSRNISAPIDT
nr:MAG TPA: hypothetical protein [Caudoviricetes sp.]